MDLSDEDITYRTIGSSRRVYDELGFGLLESAYVGALAHACRSAGLRVEREVSVPIYFDGEVVANYRMDSVVERRVLVETKACKQILPEHIKQVFHYLKATDLELGLLFNFGRRLEVRRFTYRTSLKKRTRT
jgi:GxxExxY protein